MTEKRKHPRFPPKTTIQAINVIDGRSLGVLVNLSMGGFMLMGGRSAPRPGEVYQLHLLDPAGHSLDLEVGATCIWQEPASAKGSCWCGFRFIDLSEPVRERLEAYLGELSRPDGEK